jgi:hypothetical protein
MWYSGYSDDKTYHSIGHATSHDGVAWTKSSDNPVLTNGADGSFESQLVSIPSVTIDSSKSKMWYRGRRSDKRSNQRNRRIHHRDYLGKWPNDFK